MYIEQETSSLLNQSLKLIQNKIPDKESTKEANNDQVTQLKKELNRQCFFISVH